MRPSLLPGLIAASRRNLDRGASSVMLFELGRRYLGDAEHPTLSLLLAGEKRPREWQLGKAQTFDALDAKAEVLALLEAAGAPTANLQVFADAGPTWHPGRSAKLGLGPKTIVASFRRASPAAAKGARCAGGRCRRRDLSRRDPCPTLQRARAAGLRAAAPPAGDCGISRSLFRPTCRRDLAPRHPGRRQGCDHRRPPVRPFRNFATDCRSRSR